MQGKKPTKRSPKKERAAAKANPQAAAPVSAHPKKVRAEDVMRAVPVEQAASAQPMPSAAVAQPEQAPHVSQPMQAVQPAQVSESDKGTGRLSDLSEAEASIEVPKDVASTENAPSSADAASATGAESAPDLADTAGINSASGSAKESPKRASVKKARAARPPAKKGVPKWVFIVPSIILALMLAVAGLFAWHHWLRYNDAADLQGTWYVAGTDTPIVIDTGQIQLTDEVAYDYELDTVAKTLTISFADLRGGGWYRFSPDRQQLAIVDGTYFWVDTLPADFGYAANSLFASLQGAEVPLFEGENVTLLSRTSASEAEAAGTTNAADGTGVIDETGAAAAEGEAGGEGAAGDTLDFGNAVDAGVDVEDASDNGDASA